MISINNISSSFTARNLKIVDTAQTKSAFKLSSGFKINSSADDAAGLAISEKMRAQITGLNKASKNCADAISFCQVADGAMSDLHEMVGRMRELCVQASNDTYIDFDRAKIQTEIDELNNEINKIIDTTDFNEIYVFKEGTRGSHTPPISIGNIVGYDQISGVKKLTDPLYLNPSSTWVTTGIPVSATLSSLLVSDLNNVLDTTQAPSVGLPGVSQGSPIFLPSPYNESDIAAGLSVLAGIAPPITDLDYANINAIPTITGQNTNTLSFTHLDPVTLASVTYNFDYIASADGSTDLSRLSISGDDGLGNNYLLSYTSNNTAGNVGVQGELGKHYGGSWIDFGNSSTGYNVEDLYNEGFNSTCATCNNYYSIRFVGPSNFSTKINVDDGTGTGTTFEVGYKYQAGSSAYLLDIDISNCKNGDDVVNAIMAAVNISTGFNNHFTQYAVDTSNPSKLFIYDNRTAYINGGSSSFEYFARGTDGMPLVKQGAQDLWIQSSSNKDGMWLNKPLLGIKVADNNANISVVNSLGTDRVYVVNREEAESSIGVCDFAASVLSWRRTSIGSYHNRLEHSVKIVDIASENLQSSDSRIRDTDMAKEMMINTKSQILNQAGISMMAQANASLGRVVQLLQ